MNLLDLWVKDIQTWIWIALASVVASMLVTAIVFNGNTFNIFAGVANLVFFAGFMVLGGWAAKEIRKLINK
ncbi:hypothetical protein TetV_130 [Tetraselmis virus 1]|uniref:Uncharacterized protein n=1 Tax=Tetraselmis virus 1 TaxID=2060617 RepID=A0A2P0VMT8_9VIRU|nr:hypothetical protein QJ968_gp130 [Tetraselmis virus 1]AUF82222.1 hypothetical protein TetV_130 [Tetraselmis virus 1]